MLYYYPENQQTNAQSQFGELFLDGRDYQPRRSKLDLLPQKCKDSVDAELCLLAQDQVYLHPSRSAP